MNAATGLPAWVEIATAAMLLAGAGITLVGAFGLVRLGTFYERVHAPTLGTTLGTGCVAVSSIILFSWLQTRPVVHELLILVFVTITTPVTLMILVNAALLREQSGNVEQPTPPRTSRRSSL